MPCFHPILGYRSRTVGPNGKRSIVFDAKQGYPDLPVQIPCGQCIGCRLEKSRQWAIRCLHEASLYERNCFITLTYADECLPCDGSLCPRDFQLFLKRLRKKFGAGIRFYHCGEYGDTYGRPHYHACLFNFDFDDKVLFQNKRGTKTYTSETLNDLWQKGYGIIGDVTFESAAYVARYVMKKVNGKKKEDHYSYIDDFGEVISLIPEYSTMSRRPGIGKGWLDKFTTDVYPSDTIVLHGRVMKPPSYYDRQFEISQVNELKDIKNLRKRRAKKHKSNNTKERLAVREIVQHARLGMLKRELE